jgi:hypothetical protein
MNSLSLKLFSSLSIAAVLGTSALADQITMKDGDRITGDIVKKDGDTVTIRSKNFGDVKLKWSDVVDIRTDQPLNVGLPGGQTVRGTLQTQNGQLQVGTQTVNPADITDLRNDPEQRAYQRFQQPGFLDLWAVNGSINLAGTKGNAETSTLTTPFNFVRASNTSRTTAYFNSIRSRATVAGVNAKTAQAVRGGWAYDRNITGRVIFDAFNDYEYDQFQSLDLRVVLGGGLGYRLWSGKDYALTAVAGLAWNREAFGAFRTTAAFTRNSLEAYWGDGLAFKLNSRTNLTQSFRMFNNLSNPGEYRMNFDAGAATQVLKWLTWNLNLSNRYLSDPIAGRKKNDFLYSTGFGFSFAR